MRTIRVFISSPSDASRERDRLTRVARRLNTIYAEVARFEIVRWEDDFYSAHETFQTQIPEAKTCDIVIGILKHRLGSPLPSTFPPMPDKEPFLGEPYPSGTAYEILSSIANRLVEDNDKPDIYVFRDAEPPVVSLGSGDMERIGSEWRRLEDFARRFFFTAEGDFRFAFQTFRSASQFEEQVESLLRKWIETNIYAERRSSWQVETRGSPFRALDAFDIAHKDVFFGRDRDIARSVDQLAQAGLEAEIDGSNRLPFLLLVGPSGAGKSSLLRAGLMPRLIATDLAGTEEWRSAVMTPAAGGKGPFLALAEALMGGEGGKPASPQNKPEIAGTTALPELRSTAFATPQLLADLLSHGGASAAVVIRDALQRVAQSIAAREKFDKPPKVRLLLVVDQLDEIFAPGVDDAQRSSFANLLTELSRGGLVWIAASLRAGLYENLLADPALFALKSAGAVYELGAPGSAELAEIVRKPAEAADIVFEKDPVTGRTLDEDLLADFDRPDMLPLLQFTLEALFQRREIRGDVLTLTYSAYRGMNGIGGAIRTIADAAMLKLSPEERDRLPRLLRLLVTIAPSADGQSGAFLLQDVAIGKLSADSDMLRLAEALTEARLLVARSAPDGSRSFGLAHQRLLTLWPAAEAALRDNAIYFRVSSELEQARNRWQRQGRKWSQLLRDPVLLSEASRLRNAYRDELGQDTLDFIDRSRLRARVGTLLLGTVAAVLACLFVGTIWFFLRAREAEQLALQQKARAEENFTIAQTTLEGVVSDIADGLKNIEGMSLSARARILERVQRSVDMLQFRAADNSALGETRLLMLNAFGEAYAAGGDGAKALESYRASIALGEELLKTSSGPEAIETERGIGVNLERIGDILVTQGDRAGALGAYQRSADIRQKLLAADPDNVTLQRDASVSVDRVGQAKQALGDIKGAIEAYRAGADRARSQIKLHPDDRQARRDLSVSLEHLADLELLSGARGQAAGHLDEMLALRQTLATEDPDNVEARNDLLIALMRKGDFSLSSGDGPAAATTYGEALLLSEKLAALDAARLDWQRARSIILNNLGDISLARGNRKEARQKYQQALDVSRRIGAIDPSTIRYQGDIAFGLNKLGDTDRFDGALMQAVDSYRQALEISRKVAASDPANLGMQRDVAFTLGRLADTLVSTGDTEGALSTNHEALAMLEKLAAADPANLIWQRDVVLRRMRIADIELGNGNRPKARALYDLSLQAIRKQLAGGTQLVDWQRDLAIALGKTGNIDLAEGRAADARKAFEEALAIARRLAELDPANPGSQRDVAVDLNLVGDARFGAGDIASAGQAYSESLVIVRALLAKDGGNIGLLRDLAYTLVKVGLAQQRLGDRQKALADFQEALSVSRQLAVLNSQNPALSQSDLMFSLLRVADLQTGADRLKSLTEALATAERLDAANLLLGPQKQLPDQIRKLMAQN